MMNDRNESSKFFLPLIAMFNIAKYYDSGLVPVVALHDISLKINHGEFVAIMGPSGSGKSTLMSIMALLDVPSRGSYKFGDVETTTFDDEYRALLRNRTLGFVFQQFYLLPRTTALDNVRIPLQYANTRYVEQKEKSRRVLHDVGLGDRIFHHPNQLSGGQQQRVAIARALVNNPAVLFCDEPTGNLDSRTAQEILHLLQSLHASGRTIILVTHDMNVAKTAERIVHMNDGTIIEDAFV